MTISLPPEAENTGADPEWIATGDLGRDGLSDAVVITGGGTIYVLLQTSRPVGWSG